MDYKALLLKYIHHVMECEGVTFIGSGALPDRMVAQFTDEEWAELESLDDVVMDQIDKREGL